MDQGCAAAGQRVVLFDFDGVLIHGDAFALFMRDLYSRQWWRKGLVLLAIPLLLLVALFSRRRAVRVLVHIGLAGIGERRYRELAQAFAITLVHRPRQFCREGLNALRQHQAAGDHVVIVTGCEDTLVRGVLDGLGITGVDVLASHLGAGRFGMCSVWHNVGSRKLEALARRGIDAWQVAYSDSNQDLPMLAPAAEAVLVNASPKVCKRVEKALGRSIVRKDWH